MRQNNLVGNENVYFDESCCVDGVAYHHAEIIREQLDWHASGNNGCVFSQIMAKRSDDKGLWEQIVLNINLQNQIECTSSVGDFLSVHEGALVPEVISFIFPSVRTIEQLGELISVIRNISSVTILESYLEGEKVGLGVRYLLRESGVEAWAVGFGPFEIFPATRQAPSTEIAFRLKPKTHTLYRELNQNPTQAHLADVDLALSDEVMGRVFNKTKERTAERLGGSEARALNKFASAKVTFVLPLDIWQRIKSQQ